MDSTLLFPLSIPTSPLFYLVPTICLVGLYLLYRAALPKPIPGIPFKKGTEKRLLGNFPDVLEYKKQYGEIYRYMGQLMVELDSPVVQFFGAPFSKPWVLVSDYHEARDVLTRRAPEFDRADFFRRMFSALFPKNQVIMKTTEEWKAHRTLMNDTMSSKFLYKNASAGLEENIGALIRFWREKARLAQGRPFSVMDDMYKEVLEAMWTVTFGFQSGSTKAQLDLLSNLDKITVPIYKDTPVVFPVAEEPQSFRSILALSKSLEIPMGSQFPTLAHTFALKFYPHLRAALKFKDRLIHTRLSEAWRVFSSSEDEGESEIDSRVASALDVIVQREVKLAKRSGRPASIYTRAFYDELFGFLVAGHDTTGSTVLWVLRYLTVNQSAQSRLRDALRSHFAEEGFSIGAMANKHIPYLEAVLAESLRLATVAPANVRNANVDTQLLGYPIPKGTDVFFLNNGPGYILPVVAVDDTKRSQSTLEEMQKKRLAWDDQGIEDFEPGRWIEKDDNGEDVFDSRAGPALPFGAGPRRCFGEKLADMSLRMHVASIVWHFELQPLPAELNSVRGRDGLVRLPAQNYLRLKAL